MFSKRWNPRNFSSSNFHALSNVKTLRSSSSGSSFFATTAWLSKNRFYCSTNFVPGTPPIQGESQQTRIETIVSRLHEKGTKKIVLNTTGAGAMAISWLLSVGGASRTILEAAVPYSSSATNQIVQKSRALDSPDKLGLNTEV